MTGELSQSERETAIRHHRARQSAFDVGLLSTEEIKRLGRGIGLERRERLNRNNPFESETLVDILGAAIRRKANELPGEAAVTFVRELATDEDRRFVRHLAAYALPAVVQYDYEFARDTVIELWLDRETEGLGATQDAYEEMRGSLPADRRADLETQFRQRWNDEFPGLPI